jgi:hypothetical protein
MTTTTTFRDGIEGQRFVDAWVLAVARKRRDVHEDVVSHKLWIDEPEASAVVPSLQCSMKTHTLLFLR